MYAFAIAATLLASTGLAAPTKRTEGSPFGLVANGGPYSNAHITACHSGAAIEALCVYGSSDQKFTFNASDAAPVKAGQSAPGNLIFTLPSQPQEYKQNLAWFKNETSNVRAGFFGGTQTGPVLLSIDSTSQTLGVVVGDEVQDSWYVCPQSYAAYQYNTVSWVPAGETPDNADCQAISLDLA